MIDSPMRYEQARVLGLCALAPGYYWLTLFAPEIARVAQPGQFVQLRVAATGVYDPLLARPISLFRVQADAGEISLIFKVVGRGTDMLTRVQVGDQLAVLGPVGHGFHIPDSVRSLALVGGGVGMPPLFYLAETLKVTRPELALTLFYGGRTHTDLLLLDEWEALGVTVFAATDDGSYGLHGLVTEALQRELAAREIDFLAACGPRPMLRAVQQLALARDISGQLSLEARMACGVGACLGCVCATVNGSKRVCVDGPVFALDEVNFDA